jgi:hypothetical protein
MRHVERHAMPLSRFALLALLGLLSAWPGSQVRALNHVSQAQGNLLLDSSHGNGEAWGKANCSSCHHLQRLHRSVPKIKAIVDQKKFATCTGCHGSNGSNALRQCLICHNGDAMPLQPLRGGKHRHDFSSAKDFRTTSKQCVICHQAADMDGRFELERDLTLFNDAVVAKQPYANISEFCLRCHNPDHQQRKWPIVNGGSRDQSRRAEDHYRQIDAHGVRHGDGDGDGLYNGLRAGQYRYGTVVDCTDCHTMHGTHNPSLLIEDSRQGVFLLDKTIRGQGYKVDVTGGNVSDLCVLCHNMSTVRDGGDTPAGTGLSGVHFNEGDNCLLCHNHGEEVQKGL